MLKLKKIYIQNFKGVYHPTIVNFDENELTILSGPNGFGKTTIFDVIELCLRGKLERTSNYNYVTKKTSDHKKPFYQNKQYEDVVLKVWLYDDSNNHIIIKRLDGKSDGKKDNTRAFRPDAWNLLETYYTQDITGFDNETNYQILQQITQQFIDQLFFDRNKLSLTELYPLFNYLQQEDNIYFLKKDEEQKKNELNFLFQTQKQANELDRVTEFLKNLKAIRENLASRLLSLGNASGTGEKTLYQQLFPGKEFSYDQREPFLNVPAEELDTVYQNYKTLIDQLINLTTRFDFNEYEKSKLRQQLQYATQNKWFLNSFVAQNFLSEHVFDLLKTRHDRNQRYKAYREKLSVYAVDEIILGELGFDVTFVKNYTDAVNNRIRLQEQIGEIGKIIAELNTARENTLSQFFRLNERQSQTSNCPLCNSEWESLKSLSDSVNQKTLSLNSYNAAQLLELQTFEKTILIGIISQIDVAIENHLNSAVNLIDTDFYTIISERRGNLPAVQRFSNLLSEKGIDVSYLLLTTYVTSSKLQENSELLKLVLSDFINTLHIDESKLEHLSLFAELFNENREALIPEVFLRQKQTYLTEKFNESKLFSLNVLNERLRKLTEIEHSVSKIKTRLAGVIKDYKKMMIEKIKIPFYIYSGKILQHYQQGYGIFVDVKDSTSRVRFLTDDTTDHDIIHQLSSGQLAVVSIAFCLSLNKVYQAPQHFKFLAIDDPVQTLDDLNIHSFIELMRHEFIDYQTIISTHDENIANYLMYKFEKFKFKSSKVNVQQIFYSTQ